MGLFSRKQDQASVPESAVRRPKARRTRAKGADDSDPDNPLLIQRKRARRRLLGAITLAIAAIVFLPMVFDSEPQPNSDQLSVELPAKTSPFGPKPAPASVTPAPAGSNPRPSVSGIYDQPAPVGAVESPAPPAPASAAGGGVPSAPAPAKAASDVPSGRPDSVAPVAAPRSDDRVPPAGTPGKASAAKAAAAAAPGAPKGQAPSAEQQRALALLEGRTSATDPVTRKASPGAVAVQVAALASPEKVQELVGKLSGSGIKTYTEKVDTPQGARTRVRLGPFANRDEAQRALERVKGMGLDGSLVTP